MVAAVTAGLVRPIDLGVTALTRAAVAGSDAAMIDGFIEGSKGINGSTSAAYLENAETATVDSNWYSAHASFTSPTTLDFSGSQKAFVLHFRVSNGGFNSIKGVRILLFSGGSTANWARYEYSITASGGRDGFYHPYIAIGTPTATSGTFDDTDVTGMGVAAQADGTDVYAFSMYWDQFVFIDGPAVFSDTGAAATVTLEDYYDLVKRDSSESYRTMLASRAGPTIAFGFPFDIQSDDYDDTNVAVGFTFFEADGIGYPVMPLGFFEAKWTPPASSTQVFENVTGANISTDYNMTVDASAAGCTLTFDIGLFAGVNDVVLGGAGLEMIGCTVASPATCDIADGDLDLTVNDCTASIVWSGDLAAGSVLTTDSDVDITFDVGNYADIGIVFTEAAEVTVDPTTDEGTYNLSGITSDFSINFDIPSGNTNDTTVTLPSTLTATRTNPTTGGGEITLDNAVSTTLELTGLQNPTEVRVYDTGTTTEIIGQENVTSGTFSGTIPASFSAVDVSILSLQYEIIRLKNVATNVDRSLPISQNIDRQYENE